MTTRLSLLLMALLCTSTLAEAQESAIPTSATLARRYGTGQILQKYRPISSVPIRDPRIVFRASGPQDQSLLWRVHLALQLVKHPEMNPRQVRIILDAISLASPEFFASNDTSTKKRKADEALQLLTRRALGAFADSQAARLFAKIDEEKPDDILTMYFDLSALPLRGRKVSFRNASSNIKSDLWRTHLALSLVNQSGLSARQTQIILAAMSLATPGHFEVRSTDPHWKTTVRDPLRSLEQQIVSAFSLEEASRIFATLGGDTANRSATYPSSVLLKSINYKPLSDDAQYKQWTHSRFSEQGIELERNACQCSTSSDWCPMSSACGGGSCSSTQSGCGTLWTYPCDGASCQ
jgi:hypothetical protein